MSATATSTAMAVFNDQVEYATYWEAVGKPPQFVYKEKGSQAFFHQGALIVFTRPI